MELLSIELGLELGFWSSLDDLGPIAPAKLAAVRDTDERCTQEWLEQQTVCGYLAVDDVSAAAQERRYCLLPGLDCVLLDPDDPLAMSGMVAVPTRLGALLPAVFAAFRTSPSPFPDAGAALLVEGQRNERLEASRDELQRSAACARCCSGGTRRRPNRMSGSTDSVEQPVQNSRLCAVAFDEHTRIHADLTLFPSGCYPLRHDFKE